jgi:lipoprotein signal peptidase
MNRRRIGLGLAIAALVFAADQASKQWVLHGLDLPERGNVPVLPPVLDLTMVWNHGVTFGLLQARGPGGVVLLGAVALAVIVGLLVWLRRADNAVMAAAIGAIAGGALGNVADRLRFGMVVDFIHVHAGAVELFPFVFNVGDSAIVLGVGALLLESLLVRRARLPAAPPPA